MAQGIEPQESGRRSTQLRVFFSVDLVGGTAFKNRESVEDLTSARSWPNRFEGFFQEFIRSFKERVVAARTGSAVEISPPPQLWKINGDELLFTELVYEDHEQRHAALKSSLRSFVELVQETDERYIEKGLGVRACVWTAGFPLRNKTVQVVQGGVNLIAGGAGRSDPDTGPTSPVPVTVNDYIGRDMDIGFRLAAVAPPARVVCSLDLAHFMMALPVQSGLTVWHVGWSPLKGVLNGQPYPLLWLQDERPPRARHPWDESSNEHADPTVRELLRPGNEPLTAEKFATLEKKVRDHSAGQLIVPYAALSDMPEEHRRQYLAAVGADPTRELRSEADALRKMDFAVSPGHAETITLDDLNQLLLWFQDSPERISEVRQILKEIASHGTYATWKEQSQLEGDLFRLHPSLTFASTEQRYLLESLFLVKNDALRVKINLCEDQVFITDGLWVDPTIRTFSFADESDLVMRACEESGWMDWATCVIDPATGCGHNLLRYRAEKGIRRYGFDRNARAVAYAGINATLNGIDGVTLGGGDIRQGIPPVFSQAEGERVLVVANMPFALAPNRGEIAPSADGGRYGYALTVALFDAINGLAEQLDGASELRCVILTYTVGCLRDDSWAVPNHARQRFGEAATSWKLWPEEKLWRVNGKKEQGNPMPLTELKRKADCRFYVRGNVARDPLRRGYEELTEKLAADGFDHLAYGVVTVRHPLGLGAGAGPRTSERAAAA
jgi:hypothetical protein